MHAVELALLTRSGQAGAPTVFNRPRWGSPDTVFWSKAFFLPRPLGTWVRENTIFKAALAKAHAESAIEAALVIRRNLQEQAVDV